MPSSDPSPYEAGHALAQALIRFWEDNYSTSSQFEGEILTALYSGVAENAYGPWNNFSRFVKTLTWHLVQNRRERIRAELLKQNIAWHPFTATIAQQFPSFEESRGVP